MVTTSISITFCPLFQFIQESCTLGFDRGVSKACKGQPLMRECSYSRKHCMPHCL